MSSSNLGHPLVIWKIRKISKKKNSHVDSIIIDYTLYDAQSSPFTRYRPRKKWTAKLLRSEKSEEGRKFKPRSYASGRQFYTVDQSSRAKWTREK